MDATTRSLNPCYAAREVRVSVAKVRQIVVTAFVIAVVLVAVAGSGVERLAAVGAIDTLAVTAAATGDRQTMVALGLGRTTIESAGTLKAVLMTAVTKAVAIIGTGVRDGDIDSLFSFLSHLILMYIYLFQ